MSLSMYGYSIVSACLMGAHIFAMRLMSYKKEWLYPLIAFVIFSFTLTRFLIYRAMELAPNPVFVHLILNMSIFVTFFASVFFLGIKDFNIGIFFIGLLLIVFGISAIQMSYQMK